MDIVFHLFSVVLLFFHVVSIISLAIGDFSGRTKKPHVKHHPKVHILKLYPPGLSPPSFLTIFLSTVGDSVATCSAHC